MNMFYSCLLSFETYLDNISLEKIDYGLIYPISQKTVTTIKKNFRLILNYEFLINLNEFNDFSPIFILLRFQGIYFFFLLLFLYVQI